MAVDERAVAAATLLALPAMQPRRLRQLLAHHGGPDGALAAVLDGTSGDAFALDDHDTRVLAQRWTRSVDVDRVRTRLERRTTRVWLDGDDGYPLRVGVTHPPPVLLGEGARPEALCRPRVAIVGTRAATPHGLADAHELGAGLAREGITIVSGLAIGIDGAAHEGAIAVDGFTVGVVATGLDVAYPRRHVALHDAVRRAGLLVGEQWYGVGPAPWRFPVRNRIIAGLADVVVVVEATASGGASITARLAFDAGCPVLAVPGSRRNPAAEGCNALIADGAQPLLDPADVLVALGLATAGRSGWSAAPAPPASPDAAALLRALGGEPATTDQVAGRTGLPPARVAGAARELERAGRLERRRGLLWPR